jgi:hypothetical protein
MLLLLGVGVVAVLRTMQQGDCSRSRKGRKTMGWRGLTVKQRQQQDSSRVLLAAKQQTEPLPTPPLEGRVASKQPPGARKAGRKPARQQQDLC